MLWLVLAVLALICALLPALLFFSNLRLYLPPPPIAAGSPPPAVSVLVPARNEAAHIQAAVTSILGAAEGVTCEVVVLDDDSSDDTAHIVRLIAREDPRVRLETAPPLPAGWNGKQHACACLAQHARYPLLLFVDADVQLAPGALLRFTDALHGTNLLSGVPRQVTGSFSEKLLIPLIHVVLLGYLPHQRMRDSTDPALGAGCGQFFLTSSDAYARSGGHSAIRASLHDGLHLPRLYRTCGLRTDLVDLTPLAACRMYTGDLATWRGLAKNAHQGMGAPRVIVPMTLLLLLGHVAPWLALCLSPSRGVLLLSCAAITCQYALRFVSAARFRQSCLGALLHPLGILALLAIQWWAFLRHSLGVRSAWKGRAC